MIFKKTILCGCLRYGISVFHSSGLRLRSLMTSHPKNGVKYKEGCNFDKCSKFLKSLTVESQKSGQTLFLKPFNLKNRSQTHLFTPIGYTDVRIGAYVGSVSVSTLTLCCCCCCISERKWRQEMNMKKNRVEGWAFPKHSSKSNILIQHRVYVFRFACEI